MTSKDIINTNQKTTQTNKTQCVWIVRYGLTEHALVEDVGPYDSDIDPTIGMEQAKYIAKRIAKGHKCSNEENGTATSVSALFPKVVYADPFMRTTHTGYIIAKELGENVPLRSEEGLWEWLVPSLLVEKRTGIKTHPKSVQELKEIFGTTIDDDYKSVNPYENISSSFPESEDRLFKRCGQTLSRILENHDTNNDSICIVSHAPCNQAMAFYLDDDDDDDDDSSCNPKKSSCVTPWPLGGITLFTRTVDVDGGNVSKWNCEYYGNTDHMPGEYQKGIKKWSLPRFENIEPLSPTTT